jgi:UDP-2-acetamido-3-amino-2,3-dideoxy-glucuronate N-acetyltransferase
MIHITADVSNDAKIGEGTKIWNNAQVREGSTIGKNCIIGKGAYIDTGTKMGDNVKVGNMSSVYNGSEIHDSAFIGPYVCLTNDKIPRSVNPDGTIKGKGDWNTSNIIVKKGSSIGAGSVVLPGVTLGMWSMIGSGSVVTKNVPDFGLVLGNPARIVGYVCKCGLKLTEINGPLMDCKKCGVSYNLEL